MEVDFVVEEVKDRRGGTEGLCISKRLNNVMGDDRRRSEATMT